MATILDQYLDMWRRFADFNGRTGVSDFWWPAAITLILHRLVANLPLVRTVYEAAILVPLVSIIFRRLNDAGKSRAWIFLVLIPVVGWIIAIFILSIPSKSTRGRTIIDSL